MTTIVLTTPDLPDSTDLMASKPPSTIRVAHPFANTINHIEGHLLGGLRHLQRAFDAQAAGDKARIKTPRHPNCDYVDVLVELAGTSNPPWSIEVTAGTGATQTVNSTFDTADAEGPGTWRIRAPWDASDTGACEVLVEVTSCYIQALAIFDVPRETLSAADGDTCVEQVDPDHVAVGLLPERPIAASDTAGPPALVDGTIACWDDYHPQHLSWWSWEYDPKVTTEASFGGAASSSDLFADVEITFRARLKTSGQERGAVTFEVYAWCEDAGTTGELKVTSSNPGPGADSSITSSTFTGTSKAWRSLANVQVDCTEEATITIEGRRTAGTGDVYISAVSAYDAQ